MIKQINESAIRIVIIISIIMISGLASYFEWFYPIDNYLTDKIYQRPSTVNTNIKIIGIDEKTLNELGAYGTWDREIYGTLVDKLTDEGKASIVAFDMIFAEKLSGKGDETFAKSCERAGNVVVASEVVTGKAVTVDDKTGLLSVDSLNLEGVIEPYDSLKEATVNGFAEATVDRDGYIRHAFRNLVYNGKEIDPFARVVYEQYADKKGLELYEPETDSVNRFGFEFSGKPYEYDHYSMIDVLNGNVNMSLMEDSIVLVGAYAKGLKDNYYVSVSRNGQQMYGVEVNANIIQAYLDRKTNRNVDPRILNVIVMIIVAVYIYFLMKLEIKGASVLTAFTCIGTIIIGWILYNNGIYVTPISLVVIVLLIYCTDFIYIFIKGTINRRHIVNTFKRYMESELVEHMIESSNGDIRLEDEERDVAVLFMDIRGFTALSENLSAKEVIVLLNMYFDMATTAIQKYGGMIDKFIGDAIMAVFNAPFDLDDYEYKAVQTAFRIIRGGEEFADYARKKVGQRIDFGIGIHCGRAVVGNIGTEKRMDYTAIGDVVNTASRIEGIAGKGQILVSEEMKNRLCSRIRMKSAGSAMLKGKKDAVLLYEPTEFVMEHIEVVKMERSIYQIKEDIGCDAASLWVLSDNKLYADIYTGSKGSGLEGQQLTLDQGICGYCVKNAIPVKVDDVSSDGRWYSGADKVTGYETTNMLCVPVIKDGKCLGCVELLNKPDGFTEKDIAYCEKMIASLLDEKEIGNDLK